MAENKEYIGKPMKNKGKSAQNMRRTKGENYAENIGFGVVKFM